MNIYYVYAYLRKDGTPYYIGKGKNNRAFSKHHRISVPKDKSRIVFLETNLTNIGSLALERRYIKWYGRKDLGTGILRNLTDGGEGGEPSELTKRKISSKNKGKTAWNKGTSYRKGIAKSEAMKSKLAIATIGNPSKSSEWKITHDDGKSEIVYNLKEVCSLRGWTYNTINVATTKRDGYVPSLRATFFKL
jgi:hypothetical protein